MSDLPDILNLTDAATYLRLKPRTLSTLALRGTIPGTKIGGQWRFQGRALEALFASGSAEPARGEPAAAWGRHTEHVGVPGNRPGTKSGASGGFGPRSSPAVREQGPDRPVL